MTALEELETLGNESLFQKETFIFGRYFKNNNASRGPQILTTDQFPIIKAALIQAEKDKQELANIKARADKVIFTYALDLVDISNEVKHGDEKLINDFIEAIKYILTAEEPQEEKVK